MATTTATAVTQVPLGYNQDNIELYKATVGATSAADSISVTLPERWQGRKCSIVAASCEQFATATAGARTKTNVPVSVTSHVEATGVVTLLVGATAITTNGRVHLLVAASE